MKIYVASSWRNLYQPDVVKALRAAGYDVYDFRQPVPGDEGFHWSEIDGGWKDWTLTQYANALEHPIAKRGFEADMAALISADLCVLVLPSGRSASLEYGHWLGRTGLYGIIHCPEKVEPELMYRGAQFTGNLADLVVAVEWWRNKNYGGVTQKPSSNAAASMGVDVPSAKAPSSGAGKPKDGGSSPPPVNNFWPPTGEEP